MAEGRSTSSPVAASAEEPRQRQGEAAPFPAESERPVTRRLHLHPAHLRELDPGALVQVRAGSEEEIAQPTSTGGTLVIGGGQRFHAGGQGSDRVTREIILRDLQLELDRRLQEKDIGTVQIPDLDESHRCRRSSRASPSQCYGMDESASTCTALKSAWVIIAAVVFTCLRTNPRMMLTPNRPSSARLKPYWGPCNIMNRSEGMMMP